MILTFVGDIIVAHRICFPTENYRGFHLFRYVISSLWFFSLICDGLFWICGRYGCFKTDVFTYAQRLNKNRDLCTTNIHTTTYIHMYRLGWITIRWSLDTTLGYTLRHEAILDRIYIDIVIEILRWIAWGGCGRGHAHAHNTAHAAQQETGPRARMLLRLLLMMVIMMVMLLMLVTIQGGCVTHSACLLQRMMQSPTRICIHNIPAATAQSWRQCTTNATAPMCRLQMCRQCRCRGQRCGWPDDGATQAQWQRFTPTTQAAHDAAAGRDDGAAASATSCRNGSQKLRSLRRDLIEGDGRIVGERRCSRHSGCLKGKTEREKCTYY